MCCAGNSIGLFFLDALKAIGYGEAIFIRWDDPMKLLLGKGYSIDGYEERVFHLHVRYLGNWDELYFRDYLIAHPDVAAEYGKLKENILSDIESGKIRRIVDGRPNGYSEAKLKFVEKYSKAAKEEFRNCYSQQSPAVNVATMVVALIPVLIVFLIGRKRLIAGVATTGMKM